jgi:hypothetical protein
MRKRRCSEPPSIAIYKRQVPKSHERNTKNVFYDPTSTCEHPCEMFKKTL